MSQQREEQAGPQLAATSVRQRKRLAISLGPEAYPRDVNAPLSKKHALPRQSGNNAGGFAQHQAQGNIWDEADMGTGLHEDADLLSYAAELVRALGLSARAARATQKQMAASSIREQLAVISDLESELKTKDLALPVQSRHGNQATHLEGKDEDAAEQTDQAWERLLANAELTEEQVAIMSRQYYALDNAESRLHMFLEFSSYLRPFSEAQLAFRERMKAADKNSYLSKMTASSWWPWASDTPSLYAAKGENKQTPWYKSPTAMTAAVFTTALLRYSFS